MYMILLLALGMLTLQTKSTNAYINTKNNAFISRNEMGCAAIGK